MNISTRRPRIAIGGAAFVLVAALVAGVAVPQEPQQASNLVHAAPVVIDQPEKPSPRLDSRLFQLAEIERRGGMAAAREFARDSGIELDRDGRVKVLVHQSVAPDYDRRSAGDANDPGQRTGGQAPGEEVLFELLEAPIREQVSRLGGDFRGRVSNLIDAALPIANLRDLESGFGVGFVEAAPTRRSNVISEGVQVIRANALQNSSIDYQGGDIKVGIIDLGFAGYEALLGSDLPASVTVNSFHPDGIEGGGQSPLDDVHGTACAEIVFDVVPNAQIYLANFDTTSQNAQAFDWMISQDVDVISYSIGWFNAGPGDGRGPINEAVDRVLASGAEFVTSAGNMARRHWEGQYNDPDGDGVHNFAPGDNTNAVFLEAGDRLTVLLNWDDWFTSNQDYDMYIRDENGDDVAYSNGYQNGTQRPTESISFVAETSGTYHVVILRFRSTRDVNLEMFFLDGPRMQYITAAGSVTIPADSENAVAVGATYHADDVIESFSSQGPTNDGRMKPDLSAPDGVSTAAYGNLGRSFFGTSAAAPHVAGAIALMKSRFGVFELPQIREILYGRAMDRGDAGPDNVYGHGRVDIMGR